MWQQHRETAPPHPPHHCTTALGRWHLPAVGVNDPAGAWMAETVRIGGVTRVVARGRHAGCPSGRITWRPRGGWWARRAALNDEDLERVLGRYDAIALTTAP